MVRIGAIRTLLEAGVLDAIPAGGQSISASEIAAKTGVDKELIGRLSPLSWGDPVCVTRGAHCPCLTELTRSSAPYARLDAHGTLSRDRRGIVCAHRRVGNPAGPPDAGGVQSNVSAAGPLFGSPGMSDG